MIGPARVLRLERRMGPAGGLSSSYRVAEFREGYTVDDARAGRVSTLPGATWAAPKVDGVWVGVTEWADYPNDTAARVAFQSGAWAPGRV